MRRWLWIPVALYVVWLVFGYEFHFIDYVNLAFHEAGHVFLSPFGQTIGMLGGTLAQLAFPLACILHFARRGEGLGTILCGIWFAESAMNVAFYLRDARAMALPLVGGEIHDWNWLLGRLGWVGHCEWMANCLHGLASALAVALVLALAWTLAEDSSNTRVTPTWRPEVMP